MMNKHTVETMTTAALRDLDPAPPSVLTEAERERADATFARILAAPGHDPAPAEPGRRRWLRSRLLVLVGLVGAVAVVPALLLGGGSAFATWTPTPEPLTATAAAEAATTCRAELAMPDHGEPVVSAERRGEWTYLLIAGPNAEAACLMRLTGDYHVADRKSGFFGSYDPDPVGAPTLASDRMVETESMEGSVSVRGRLPFTTDDGWFNWVQGYVGSDVTGVTVHPPTGPDVEASVDGGRFAAWWPSEPPSSDNPAVMEGWTYTVTLADGSTRSATG
jgi:hypothetical protein